MLAIYYLGYVKWEFSEVNFSLLPTLGTLLKKVCADLEILIIHPAFCFFRVQAHKAGCDDIIGSYGHVVVLPAEITAPDSKQI